MAKLNLLKKYRDWKNENPEKAETLEFVGAASALCLGSAVVGYAWGKSAGIVDGYWKGAEVGTEVGKVTGGLDGYREGYASAYAIGYYNGSSRVLAVINKDKKDGDDWITPFPEMFDHPGDYLEMILSDKAQDEMKRTATRLCDAGITADNMFDYDKGFDAYYSSIMDDEIPKFLENNQEFIQKKAEERLKANSFETLEI